MSLSGKFEGYYSKQQLDQEDYVSSFRLAPHRMGSVARAAGETAPLLMIGMMAFIVDVPSKITDKATVLPAQIYMWANNPERSFEYLTSAAILILLVILIMMNLLAILLRKKYERRW